MDGTFSTDGCDAAFNGAMKFISAESDLVGGGGFTLVEEPPSAEMTYEIWDGCQVSTLN